MDAKYSYMQKAKLEHLTEIFDPSSWKTRSNYVVAGENLIDEINDLNPKLVIDAGCGHNQFKGKVKNLVGFDILNFPNADFISSIQDADFKTQSADVVIALGSIQFGTKQEVYEDVGKIASWLKPSGYIVMRVLKDQVVLGPLGNKPSLFRYYWSEEDIDILSTKYNLTVERGPFVEETKDNNGTVRGHRLVWWWKKNG